MDANRYTVMPATSDGSLCNVWDTRLNSAVVLADALPSSLAAQIAARLNRVYGDFISARLADRATPKG